MIDEIEIFAEIVEINLRSLLTDNKSWEEFISLW